MNAQPNRPQRADPFLSFASFLWGAAEATLFFIVPDVLLSYIGVRHGPRAAATASVYAAIGAAVGGAAMHWWAWGNPEDVRAAVLAIPAISEAMVARAEIAMTENWFVATLLGPLTSTPFKVYATLAPAVGAPFGAFFVASIIARLPRFLGVGIGSALIAAYLRRRKLPERTILGILAGCWIAFYALFFLLMPS